jgi:hypothetical protein
MTITLTREEAQQVFHALKSCSGVPHWPALIPVIETLSARLSAPQREWQGLTDEEKHKTWYEMQNIMGWYSFQEIANAIEAKLKEKNT